ncbi:MAG TPA: hypothetical protein DCX07_03830, partial [Phycisphaerales bacterium]|nr:hypothetical protein [Phycisphaerales bacterium]
MTGEYDGQKYVLVSDKPGQTMVRGEDKDAWGLLNVYGTKDHANQPAVSFEFDDRGAELFAALTKTNIDNALAIVVDGRIVSAPIIRTALGKTGMITGKFTEQEAAALVHALRAGMPPASQPLSTHSATPSVDKDGVVWGAPENGIQAGLRYGTSRHPYEPGEQIDFLLLVRNVGSADAVLDDYVPLSGWGPTVHDANGKRLPVAIPAMGRPVKIRRSVLKSGQMLEVGRIWLELDAQSPDPHIDLSPGEYRVSQTYRFDKREGTTWAGEISTGQLPLTVVVKRDPQPAS